MSGLNHRIRELRRIVPLEQRYDPAIDGPRLVHPVRARCSVTRMLLTVTLLGAGSLWLTSYRIASPREVDLLAQLEQTGLVRVAAASRDAESVATYMRAAGFLRDLLLASRHSDGGPAAQTGGLPSDLTPEARALELLRVLRTHVENGRTDLITVAAGILALRQDGLLEAVATLGTLPPRIRQRLFANKASRLNAWLRHENLQLAEETAELEFTDELRRHRERVATADRERRMQIQVYEGQYAAFQTEAQKYLHSSGITYQARKQLLACLQSVQRRIGANKDGYLPH